MRSQVGLGYGNIEVLLISKQMVSKYGSERRNRKDVVQTLIPRTMHG